MFVVGALAQVFSLQALFVESQKQTLVPDLSVTQAFCIDYNSHVSALVTHLPSSATVH